MKLGEGAYRNLFGLLLVSAFVLVFIASTSSATGTAVGIETKVKEVGSNVICALARALAAIVTGIAALVFVLAGVKWTASENDPGARKAAKEAMIHAIVGMILLLIIQSVISTVGIAGLCGSVVPT
ncbi:MAG: hypothetical protein V1703_04200 [Candidatus Altiarchaeota archaeon]